MIPFCPFQDRFPSNDPRFTIGDRPSIPVLRSSNHSPTNYPFFMIVGLSESNDSVLTIAGRTESNDSIITIVGRCDVE